VDTTQIVTKIRQIRPLWIAIGTGILTICAGLAICTAVFGVGMTAILSPKNPPTAESTVARTPTQLATAPTISTPLAAGPTQIPLPGAVLSPPPQVATAVNNSPIGAIFSDPAEAVRSYYQWIDANRYDLTWPLLSENFKQTFNCCAPNYSYREYTDWWDSVDRIEAVEVSTVQQDSTRAIVFMELHYWMKAGGQSVDRAYMHLIRDPVAGWLFDNKTDTI
jgi:hypothetical protein